MNNGNAEERQNLITMSGATSSFLEHRISESLYEDPHLSEPRFHAVSAIKALSIAANQGQRIYEITNENASMALQGLSHDHSAMTDIANSVAAGKTVITHSDPISVPGWNGSGYIVLDTVSGSDAYMISGGSFGGEMSCYYELCDIIPTTGQYSTIMIKFGFALGVLAMIKAETAKVPAALFAFNALILSYLYFIETMCECDRPGSDMVLSIANALMMAVLTAALHQLRAKKLAGPAYLVPLGITLLAGTQYLRETGVDEFCKTEN